jgi:formylglycine-generating enzyme required for sulfatase activity
MSRAVLAAVLPSLFLLLCASGCSKENDLDTTNNNYNNGGGDAGGGAAGSSGSSGGAAGSGGLAGSGGTGAGASGSGGSSLDGGGTGGATDAAWLDASTEGCPLEAGDMIRVPEGFCIDVTEVTRARYQQWLEEGPFEPLPAVCTFKDEDGTGDPRLFHKPSGNDWPPLNEPVHPVVGVDWCDARAYCAGVGKRLCGQLGTGEAVDFALYASASKDEWFAACTSGGQNPYPYGDTFDEDACHVRCVGTDCVTEPVATAPGCTMTSPGYQGLTDLSGNAWEWENCCDNETGKSDDCRVRGGSVFSQFEGALACASETTNRRSARLSFIGFRCCATPDS